MFDVTLVSQNQTSSVYTARLLWITLSVRCGYRSKRKDDSEAYGFGKRLCAQISGFFFTVIKTVSQLSLFFNHNFLDNFPCITRTTPEVSVDG